MADVRARKEMRPKSQKQSYKSHRILSISLPLPISRSQTEMETETSFDSKPVMISGSPSSLFRSLRCICMDCCVFVGRRWRPQASLCKQLVYHPLSKDEADGGEKSVTVVVGKEKRVFFVDPFVLEKNPFGALLETKLLC